MIKNNRPANLLLRLTCTGLALLILVSSFPFTGVNAEADRYGKIKMDKVIFRIKIGVSDLWSRLNTGWVCKILEEQTVDDVLWYKVTSNVPEHLNRSYTGYIRGDMLTVMNGQEAAAWLSNPEQMGTGQTSVPMVPKTVTPAPAGNGVFAIITKGGVNLRATPGGASLAAFPMDTVVSILEEPENSSSDAWYKVTYQQYTGYIAAESLRVISASEAETIATAATPTAGQALGYITITLRSTNLRATPGERLNCS